MSGRDRIVKAILGGKVGGPTPTGIHAYHSSPHDFDRFENRLLTGEGANVYGAGTYLAENPAVSGQGGRYWQQFLPRFEGAERFAADRLKGNAYDLAAALKVAADEATYWKNMFAGLSPDDPGRDYVARMAANQQKALELLQSGGPVGPRTYEVNFRAKPEELLDWDKPLRQQTEQVAKALTPFESRWRSSITDNPSGQQIYDNLAASMPGWGQKADAARILRDEAGIPGIRYLDEGSRINPEKRALEAELQMVRSLQAKSSAPDYMVDRAAQLQNRIEAFPLPTYNYVAFEPGKLDIMAKYGVVGGVPLGALAAQDRYGAQQ